MANTNNIIGNETKGLKIRVSFDTRAFYASHGTNPKGRGGWAFALTYCPKIEDVYFAPGCLTYSEAKAWATAMIREKAYAVNPNCTHVTLYAQP